MLYTASIDMWADGRLKKKAHWEKGKLRSQWLSQGPRLHWMVYRRWCSRCWFIEQLSCKAPWSSTDIWFDMFWTTPTYQTYYLCPISNWSFFKAVVCPFLVVPHIVARLCSHSSSVCYKLRRWNAPQYRQSGAIHADVFGFIEVDPAPQFLDSFLSRQISLKTRESQCCSS